MTSWSEANIITKARQSLCTSTPPPSCYPIGPNPFTLRCRHRSVLFTRAPLSPSPLHRLHDMCASSGYPPAGVPETSRYFLPCWSPKRGNWLAGRGRDWLWVIFRPEEGRHTPTKEVSWDHQHCRPHSKVFEAQRIGRHRTGPRG